MESGKFYKPLIYFVRHNRHMLSVGEQISGHVATMLIDCGGMVVWENQGSFKLIANPVLRNLRTHYETARSIKALYPRMKPPTTLNELSWEQGINITPETAKSLLSVPHDNSDELCDTDAAAQSTSEDHADQP